MVRLDNLGLKCVGPSSSGRGCTIEESCPHGNIIDLDTAQLKKMERTGQRNADLSNAHQHVNPNTGQVKMYGAGLSLPPRCVSRSTARVIREWMQEQGMVLSDSPTECQKQSCSRLAVYGSIGCADHLATLMNDMRTLQGPINAGFENIYEDAAKKVWTPSPKYGYDAVVQRMTEISSCKRPGSDLLLLDDEYSGASHQLWEFAIIERISGDVSINTVIDHQGRLNYATTSPNSSHSKRIS